MHYHALKSRLLADFPSDRALRQHIAAASSLDEILVALGRSYRAAVRTTADLADDGSPETGVRLDGAERAVEARETTLLELLQFFDRDRAATETTEVRRTGPRHLRVRSLAPAPAGPRA
jgi:hypothetical protein